MEKEDNLVEQLRSRGITCGRLKSMESRERKEAADFRKLNFNKLAEVQEGVANQLKSVRDKVCKLR